MTITRRGEAIAQLTPIPDAPRKPADLEALRALTAAMPMRDEGAAAFVRAMRGGDRYRIPRLTAANFAARQARPTA